MGDLGDQKYEEPPPPSYSAATSDQPAAAPPAEKASYTAAAAETPSTAVPARAYEIQSPSFSRILQFKDPASQATHFTVTTSSLTSGMPDLVLRAGDGKTGTILGTCRFHTWKPDELTLGDPEAAAAAAAGGAAAVQREDAHLSHGRYDFTADVGDGAGRRSLTWRRTRASADGVHGLQKLASTNYVLADRASGEELAVHLAKGLCGWSANGAVELKVAMTPALQALTLLTVASLVVRAIRRTNVVATNIANGC